MKKGTLAIFAAISLMVAFVVWKLVKPSDTAATAEVTQPRTKTPAIPTTKSKTDVAPAQLTINVSEAKGPLANARVRIAPQDGGGDVIVLETNKDGVASSKLAPGTYAVSASAKDHEPVAPPEVKLEKGETKKLSIVLATGGRTLSGLVTDVSGGPIAGARIDAAKLGGIVRTPRPSSAVATTITGADGRYAMTVTEGQLLVAARSSDYAAQSRYVDVGAAGATADFSLVPGGVVEGIVLDDRTKQPVTGAQVSARRDSASIMLAEGGAREVVSGEGGRFRLTGLRPGAYELDAQHESRRSKSPTIVGIGVAEQITDVTILVGRGPVVRGTVLDDKNAPVANAQVHAMDRSRTDPAKSDAKGAFVLEGLRTGGHFLIARSDNHVTAGGAPVEVGDKDVAGIVLRVKKGAKLEGHVEPRQAACDVRVEPKRERMGRAGFMMMIAPTTSDDRGEFAVGPLAADSYEISARCPNGDQGSVAVDWDGSREVTVDVKPGASIAGKLLDGDGKPIAGATVMAASQGAAMRTTIVNGMVTSGIQGITNAAGAYELVGMQAGTYRLTALDRGRPLRSRKPAPVVTLAATDKKTGVDLRVDRSNGVIKGVVSGPDGKPLADAWVSVQPDLHAIAEEAMGGRRGPDKPGDKPGPEGEGRTTTIEARDEGDGGAAGGFPPVLTDAQGRFEITGLPHMAFDVVAEAQAGKLRGRADAITPDATLAIKALGVTSLSGTVRGPKGPASLFTVEIDGPIKTQRSFTDGTFTLGRVDPGTYKVRVRSADGNGETSVTVAPNTPTTVDIMLVANAAVVGTIVDAAGKPMPDIPVHVTEDDGDNSKLSVSISSPPLTSGPDGKFRIEHKAGKAMLVVLTGARPIARRGLALEAGKTLDVGAIALDAK